MPFEVPEGWVWCKLEDIAYVASGSTPDKTCFVENGVPYIKMYNLRNQKIDFAYHPQYITEEVHNGKLQRSRTEVGDLIMNIVGPPLGKLAIIPTTLPQANFNQAAVLIRPYKFKEVLVSYLKVYLEEMSEINSIATRGSAGQVNISLTQSQNMRIPIPPLNEVRRIIDEVSKYDILIDSLKQNITDIQNLIAYTKSKILDLAIHGKLVPQDPNEEPAIELLKRINPDFTPCDNGHYTQLPEGWTVCRLEQVADILDNLRKPINASERESRIKNRQIDELYPYYGATGQVGLIDDYVVNGHYLLLGEDGAPFLDKNAIKAYSISGKSWVNNHAHILSPKIDFEFLQYSLNQIDYSEYVNGSTRLKLTQTDMRSIIIMLPPLAEQKRIRFKIRTLFSQLDLIMESL